VLVDHDRLLLGTEDALCVVELNKDSKLLCHIVDTAVCMLVETKEFVFQDVINFKLCDVKHQRTNLLLVITLLFVF